MIVKLLGKKKSQLMSLHFIARRDPNRYRPKIAANPIVTSTIQFSSFTPQQVALVAWRAAQRERVLIQCDFIFQAFVKELRPI
ncbi:hypothetical protein F8388_018942 [Cannabis sativa]|uniref:Uncharacterized protein n=1 Tax=Cannabis sativa TaxID=3483 RepID=A0A7J6ETY5_CANSA|nr:hypothetical protein F8388_018942 [Cannabis sativa]